MSLITTSSSELSTPLQQYLREIGEVELLTAEEEIELAKLIHKGLKAEKQLKQAVKIKRDKTFIIRLKKQIRSGDEARKKMISANLRLVVKIAQEYAHYGVPLLDLISEGNLGLIKAIERFDPKKGAKLSTYGAWWIKQAVRRALSDQGKTIRLPVHLSDKIAKMRRITAQLNEEFGREPTDEELAEEMHTTTTKVARLRTAGMQTASLNTKIGEEGISELGEIIGDENTRRPDDLISNQELTKQMLKLIQMLDPREQIILRMRYGLDGKKAMTLEEVGEKFKVTRERIRQLQNMSLKKLELAMTEKVSLTAMTA
ncbi:MAG: sigma-70 family RNA polymerase sigma factor [Verrucomicrobiae bacterium]|nr:sigma-70 family RNA polymerase sigma factor [Verrucomicrobiae bacterium]